MSELEIKFYEPRNQVNEATWYDEAKTAVPATRITKAEKAREKNAYSLYTKSLKLSRDLVEYKQHMAKICEQVYSDVMKQYAIEPKGKKNEKGNFKWYNFDRSIKVEVSINENIAFDELLIKAAKEKLDSYISAQLSDKDDFIRELVTDAFSTQKGSLDAKKVLSLLKYRHRVKANVFGEALNLIEQSIRRPDSKQYMRIFFKQESGEYKMIDLNFSSL